MRNSIQTSVRALDQVGEARRAVNDLCVRVGGDATFCGRASLVATELARNLVLHAGGGEIITRELEHRVHAGIEILSLDQGPGMRNVGECLRDGYSTSGTPGTGMGAIQRLSDVFELSTTEGRGTVICAQLFPTPLERNKSGHRIGAVCVPVAGEDLCGDAWSLIENPSGVRILVADGLGHGAFAADASREAVAAFRDHPHAPLDEVLHRIHDGLRKTRGAAAAIAEIHAGTRKVTMAGVGNISVRILDGDGNSRQLASGNGTLGAAFNKINQFKGEWTPQSLLILHSDGVSGNWQPDVYPGLLQRHPAVIAGVIFRDFARRRDDATMVVASYPQ